MANSTPQIPGISRDTNDEGKSNREEKGGCLKWVSLIIVAIVGLVIWLVLQVEETGNRVKCAHNLQLIGTMLSQYASGHQGYFPSDLSGLISDEDNLTVIFICNDSVDTPSPGRDGKAQAANLLRGGHCSYVYLGKGMTDKVSPDAVVAYESLGNHGDGMNVLFGNGHVAFVVKANAKKMLNELAAGRNPPQR